MHESGWSHVPGAAVAGESVRQRLDREEKERQDYLAHLTDADIQADEDGAAARRKALLDARVNQAKLSEGHAHAHTAPIATRGIEYAIILMI